MNERIKQLADEADIKFSAHWQHQGVDTAVIVSTDLEKFAELLEKEFEAKHFSAGYIQGRSDGTIETVRECADLFEIEYGKSEVSGNEVATVLKEHFGVEE